MQRSGCSDRRRRTFGRRRIHEFDWRADQRLLDAFLLIAGHHNDIGDNTADGLDDMADHRAGRNIEQQLVAAHTPPFAASEDDRDIVRQRQIIVREHDDTLLFG